MNIEFLCTVLYDHDPGNYCPIGSSAVVPCPGGTYGSVTGLQTELCSGQCTAGMGMLNCDFNRVNTTLFIDFALCLYTNHCYSGNYCPVGSAAVIQCPAGTWGSTTGLMNAACSGQCTAGMGM